MTSYELLKEIRRLTAPPSEESPSSYFLNVAFTLAYIGRTEIDLFVEEDPGSHFEVFRAVFARVLGRPPNPESRRTKTVDEAFAEAEAFLLGLDLKRYFLSLSQWES